MSDLGLPSARPAVSDERRQLLYRRIRWFVAATISYNVVEAIIALTEGARVSSTALVGFGLDSVIEVSSAAAVAWQFAGKDPESREKAALRVIAFSFFAPRRLRHRGRGSRAVRFRRSSPFDDRDRFGGGQLGDHARLVVGSAPRWAGTRVAVGCRRFQANAAVYLPVRGASGRTAAQQRARMVLGRPHRGAGHRGSCSAGRPGSLARSNLLPRADDADD